MALETLFRIEEKFSDLKFVQHIRRDPALGGPQLYLYDETNKDGKLCVSFVQALGDAAKNQISLYPFLKPQQFWTINDHSRLPGCAIDERERLLYVLSGGGPKNISLKLIHLHYEAPDEFGYRRIVAVKERSMNVRNHLVCPTPPPFRLLSPYLQSLSICPATGRLVAGYMIGGGSFTFPISNYQAALFPADLVYNKNQRTAVVKAVTDRLPFMTNLQSIQIQINSPIFSRSNHLLFWLAFHQGLYKAIDGRVIQPTPDDDGCVILRSFIPAHPENGHLNTLKIDPVKLVKSLLPKSVFDDFLTHIPNALPEHLFFGNHLRLLGDVHKYMTFCFQWNYILAVKWPREWYKLPEIPSSTRVSKLLRLDKERKWGQIDDACLYGTDLYLKSELGQAQIVRRMALGHKFKDYRCCAFCGKEETGKKRNKEGKRMSRFKVCRTCKQLNFHLFLFGIR